MVNSGHITGSSVFATVRDSLFVLEHPRSRKARSRAGESSVLSFSNGAAHLKLERGHTVSPGMEQHCVGTKRHEISYRVFYGAKVK